MVHIQYTVNKGQGKTSFEPKKGAFSFDDTSTNPVIPPQGYVKMMLLCRSYYMYIHSQVAIISKLVILLKRKHMSNHHWLDLMLLQLL